MTTTHASYLLILILLTVSGSLFAQKPDKKGSQDHPLVSRFEGFSIDKYEEVQFDRYELPLGPAIDTASYGDYMTLEGKVTKIFYVHPQQPAPSLLQVFKSYESVFASKDLEVIYSCFKEECGKGSKDFITTAARTKRLLNGFMGFGDHAYKAVKVSQNSKDIYVALYIKQEKKNTAYELHFVEVMQMNMGNITMADIEKGIEETGKKAFYGLYFDTGKSSLKDSAKAELDLLAEYLTNNAEQDYFIVGHTDNVGSYTGNLSLSNARATSVIDALKKDYGLDISNLQAVGVGPVSPVAANNSDAGKAQNRRVELVLR